MQTIFIVGGAGFIGSHAARYFLSQNKKVTVFDNFSSGKTAHFATDITHPNLHIIKNDIKNLDALTNAMRHHDIVLHFAANPDIAKAMKDPTIDFWQGTYLTQQVLEAMRLNRISYLLYASGSGVYGDHGTTLLAENSVHMQPVSTYGAGKLASESLISAYCHLFNMHAAAFRFANVVGPHQTHGVAYDFIRRLKQTPHILNVLGNGTQSKSYIHVTDILAAMHLVMQKALHQFSYWNVATEDALTVKEIAQMVIEAMQLNSVDLQFENQDRGWQGDVPVIRLDSQKIRALGWKNTRSSHEAMRDAIHTMLEEPL